MDATLVARMERAITTWRASRESVSEFREVNIGAWMVELGAILDELRVTEEDLIASVGMPIHDWVEEEYSASLEEPSSPAGSV